MPEDLVRAAVQVLGAWDWAQRPSVIASVGSGSRPTLVASLAARLGEIGRLPVAGTVPHSGPSARGRSNSALRLREIWNTYAVEPALADAVAGKPVLLVDDVVDTGWTMAVVALLLRQGGASAVYPFALGSTG